jgi:NitT/TauT family transport system permease protein
MTVATDRPEIVIRPEFVASQLAAVENVDVERELPLIERIWNYTWLRRLTVLLLLIVGWQSYTYFGDVEPLLFPSFLDSWAAMIETLWSGELVEKVWVSIQVLLYGYAAGLAFAALLLIFAVSTRIGSDFLTAMTAMFQPLPAISLLPLAMLWFGLGVPSLIFVIIHSVLWAVALSTHVGFMGVTETLRMVGRNYGVRGLAYIWKILVPAALPSIVTGLKIGWAFAWRTLIGAELVFGAASGKGGLGWFVYQKGENLETPYVFAGLFMVIVVGLLVESVIFRTLEERTIKRWGMQS